MTDKQVARAGGEARVRQAGRDNIDVQVSIGDVQVDLRQTLMVVPGRSGHSPAVLEDEEAAIKNRVVDLVIDKLSSLGTSIAQEFTRPRMRSAVRDAQDAAYRSEGGYGLADQLSELLVGLAQTSRGSLEESTLRLALDCLPRLTPALVNALSISFILRECQVDTRTLAGIVEDTMKWLPEFLSDLPKRHSEYDYLYSTGVATQVTVYSDPWESLLSSHYYAAQQYIPNEKMQQILADAGIEHSSAIETELDPENPAMSRLSKKSAEQGRPRRIDKTVIDRILNETVPSVDDFKLAIANEYPDLDQIFHELEISKPLLISANSTGKAIAIFNWNRFDSEAVTLQDYFA